MTLDSVLAARVFDLSQPLESSLQVRPANLPYKMSMVYRHGDFIGADGTSAALEALTMSSHSGTHIDALSHISCNGKFFGGESAEEAQRGGRLKTLGVEAIAPFVYRGVLLDVAAALRVDRYEAAQPVTRDDLEQAAKAQGTEVPADGAVLIRTGWGDRDFYRSQEYLGLGGSPGPDESGAEWLIEHQTKLTGTDTINYECVNPAAPGIPVHKKLIVESGVYIIENLFLEELSRERVYDFALIAAPLLLTGASGSPLRPLALAA